MDSSLKCHMNIEIEDTITPLNVEKLVFDSFGSRLLSLRLLLREGHATSYIVDSGIFFPLAILRLTT